MLQIHWFKRKCSLLSMVVLLNVAFLSLVPTGPVHAQLAQKHSQPIVLPKKYRTWQLISVAHEEGDLHDLRAVLGNSVAVEAFTKRAADFPNGAKIVRIAWQHTSSPENNRAFGRQQSFTAGEPTNIQLMVRDKKKYADTGGWGYAQFAKPNAVNEVSHPETCAACHQTAAEHGFVFTRYAR